MKPAKVKLLEAAQVLQPMLEDAINSMSEQDYYAHVDGLPLGREYILSTHETLNRLLKGEPISYRALYESITLEMLANSSAWSNLRLWARCMC